MMKYFLYFLQSKRCLHIKISCVDKFIMKHYHSMSLKLLLKKQKEDDGCITEDIIWETTESKLSGQALILLKESSTLYQLNIDISSAEFDDNGKISKYLQEKCTVCSVSCK